MLQCKNGSKTEYESIECDDYDVLSEGSDTGEMKSLVLEICNTNLLIQTYLVEVNFSVSCVLPYYKL